MFKQTRSTQANWPEQEVSMEEVRENCDGPKALMGSHLVSTRKHGHLLGMIFFETVSEILKPGKLNNSDVTLVPNKTQLTKFSK